MDLVSYVIDGNGILPFDTCLFRFEGREFAFHGGTDTECYSVETIIDDQSEFDAAYDTLQRFLNGFGWDNHCAFQIIGVNSMGLHEKVELPRKTPLSRFSRQSRSLLVGFDGTAIPPSQEAEIALSLLAEARMSQLPFYEFLCYWKILEIRYPGRTTAGAEEWLNEALAQKRNIFVAESIREMQAQGRNIGKYFGNKCRNAIAHIERPPVLVASNFRDLSRIWQACGAIAPFAEHFIKHELNMPDHSFGIEVIGVTGERDRWDIRCGSSRNDVNTASQGELETLPGIGPVLARRIIEGRPYRSTDDLTRVKGIGEKTLENVKSLVTVE